MEAPTGNNDLALGFRESLFSFEAESKTMEASTGSRDVEEVPTNRLDSHSYSVDDFLDDIDKSRGSPPLRRSACEDWRRWVPSDTREYEDFMRNFSFWDDMAATLIHPLEIEGGINDPNDRSRLSIVRCRAQVKSNMTWTFLTATRKALRL